MLVHCCLDCKLVQPPRKTVLQVLKKLKIELPYDSAISLLDIHTKELKAGSRRDICTLARLDKR